ncbi:hypothetical protein [Agarivorans sp.]|uniref:hypothetical protein n=1 Tax=Agarivorans sp. TaxID=1872412 RepID=UPI003D087321
MVKDPRVIDKRIPLVLALLVGLFCYYTWAPNSPFRKQSELALEQAIEQQFNGWVSGEVQLLSEAANGLALAQTGAGAELRLNLPKALQWQANSRWQIRGQLTWPQQQAHLDLTMDNAKLLPLDN